MVYILWPGFFFSHVIANWNDKAIKSVIFPQSLDDMLGYVIIIIILLFRLRDDLLGLCSHCDYTYYIILLIIQIYGLVWYLLISPMSLWVTSLVPGDPFADMDWLHR